jgi:hypothetical protein
MLEESMPRNVPVSALAGAATAIAAAASAVAVRMVLAIIVCSLLGVSMSQPHYA